MAIWTNEDPLATGLSQNDALGEKNIYYFDTCEQFSMALLHVECMSAKYTGTFGAKIEGKPWFLGVVVLPPAQAAVAVELMQT